jgi:hypothetical protein
MSKISTNIFQFIFKHVFVYLQEEIAVPCSERKIIGVSLSQILCIPLSNSSLLYMSVYLITTSRLILSFSLCPSCVCTHFPP